MRASAVRVDADALDLIAEATAAACGIDRRHRIVYWNDAVAALLGWTSRDALGRNCYDVFAGHDVFGNICCFQDCGVAVASLCGETVAPFVMDVRHRDGTPLRLVTRTVAVPSPGAAYRCLVHLFEHGDGAALATILTRLRSVVAPKPEQGHAFLCPVTEGRKGEKSAQRSKRMPKREYTIIFLPHARARFRQFRVSSRLLWSLGVCFGLSILLGVTFSALWVRSIRKNSEVTAILAENSDLRSRAALTNTRIETIAKMLAATQAEPMLYSRPLPSSCWCMELG
jgi:hypothetical protein